MKRKFRFYLFMLIGCLLMAACINDEKKAGPVTTVAKKPAIMDPFRFHKMIEVSPGQDYDILSWGRGSTKDM